MNGEETADSKLETRNLSESEKRREGRVGKWRNQSQFLLSDSLGEVLTLRAGR
jgi:hypothetical protein